MSQQKKNEFQGESIEVAKQHSSMEITKKKTPMDGAFKHCNTIFLLLETEQFERFEHWIRMGLIYLEFHNSGSKQSGLTEERGRIPVCSKPVNFDVLVQVKLTPSEYSKIQWCEEGKEFGWLSPGILPINRLIRVQFASFSTLESTSKYLKEGSKVPDVLMAYQSQFEWSVAEVPDGEMSKNDVIAIYRNNPCQDLENDVKERVYNWDRDYGQLSFLKSLSEGYPDIKLTTHIVPRIAKILGKSWKGIKKLEAEIQQEICWADGDFYSAIEILKEMKAFYNNQKSPETIRNLRDHSNPFAKKLGKFIEDADFRWGKVLSEDQPLTSNFEVIEKLHADVNVDSYLFTQAILVLSQSAFRLNLNAYGEPQSNARSRNFAKGANIVYMTSLPTDSVNTLLAECCFSSVKNEDFEIDFWLEQLNLKEDTIIDLTESQVIIFGMRFDRHLSSMKSAQIFVQLANKLQTEKKSLQEEHSQLVNEISNIRNEKIELEGRIQDLKGWLEKGVSLLKS
jgi:hypothetical protein